MNEAGVFGRFVPDFGRVVAQMQFDMYHHYTVDEHSIRAIGLLAAIERGELADDHPLSTALFRQIGSRRTLYVAVLLHDIAKGRGGDHSVLGERGRAAACARASGSMPAETETVAWLVRHHLLMSATAFKRDLADPKTIEDFVRHGAKPGAAAPAADPDRGRYPRGRAGDLERLEAAAAAQPCSTPPRSGCASATSSAAGREQVEERQAGAGRPRSAGRRARSRAHARACPTATGSPSRPTGSSPTPARSRDAEARIGDRRAERRRRADEPQAGATRVSVFAPDRPGLFYRICAGLAAAGAIIVDARIHTTRDGMALDNLLVQDAQRPRLCRPAAARPAGAGRRGSAGFRGDAAAAARRRRCRAAGPPSQVAPSVVDCRAGVDAERRWSRSMPATAPACSPGWRWRIHDQGLQLHSAHIATYGERAVDVFYLTRSDGAKLGPDDAAALRAALLAAAGEPESRSRAA